MPSLSHELLARLLTERPDALRSLLPDDLRDGWWPEGSRVESVSIDFTEVVPAQYLADNVLRVGDPPTLVAIVEAQLRRDPEKARSWPVYAATARARFDCAAIVVVVAQSIAVERWARTPLELSPGVWWSPVVLGPSRVPADPPESLVRARPEVGVLSLMLHGHRATAASVALRTLASIGEAALQGDKSRLAEDAVRLYVDVVLAALTAATRAIVLKEMELNKEVYRSEFARRYVAEGRTEGRTEGRAEGRTEGQVEGRAAALLAVLDARGLRITDAQRERVNGCTDPEVLDRWLRQAVVAPTTEEALH